MHILGIDIGGSSIKSAVVDVHSGRLCSTHLHITIQNPNADTIIESIGQIIAHFRWEKKPLGIGFPGVIQNNIIQTAANLHPSCIQLNIPKLVEEKYNTSCYIINDADAAGLAEIAWGEGKQTCGTVMMLTLGTGIGSSLFYNKKLFPNTELGHIIFQGERAETFLSAFAKEKHQLSYEAWAKRLEAYLQYLHSLFWPEKFILGGAISKEYKQFIHLLQLPVPVVPAHFFNDAGIIGAAVHCKNCLPIL